MLSSKTQERIRATVETYPKRRTALLPALKLAQDEVGFLPPEAVAEVADLVGVSHAAAQELTTFYSMLHTEPGGAMRVEVCVQLPCAVVGAERVLQQLSSELKLAPGETSADGRVTLIRTAECLGACHRAPMCRLNDEYVERLSTPEAVGQLVNRLRGDGPNGPEGGRRA
jgi:NADH-quinone oxidoreductase subunit E